MSFTTTLIIVSIVTFGVLAVLALMSITSEDIAERAKICAAHGETLIPPSRYSDPHLVYCATRDGTVVIRKR